MIPRLKEVYTKEIKPSLKEKYGFKKKDAIIYKIGEFGSLKKLLNYN